MRLKPSICALFVVFWALTSAYATTAQESQDGRMPTDELSGGLPVVRTDPDPDPEKNAKSATSVTASGGSSKEMSRDSIQNKVVKPYKIIEKHAAATEEDEDPLSFNFLYYIIEKFKLSDIVE